MKVLTEGHRYLLEDFEPNILPKEPHQILQFIEKNKKDDSDELETINNGTTNEEVLKVLIDRLQFLSKKLPSRETALAITKLEEALMWLEKRTKDRIDRNVEGTYKK